MKSTIKRLAEKFVVLLTQYGCSPNLCFCDKMNVAICIRASNKKFHRRKLITSVLIFSNVVLRLMSSHLLQETCCFKVNKMPGERDRNVQCFSESKK